MRLLLDTHALLWWLADDPQLDRSAAEAIAEADVVAVSAASAWEIAIKQAIGKLSGPDDLPGELVSNGFTELPVSVVHAVTAGALPPHHADPFDRMLIAQARIEALTLVTRDPRPVDYGIAWLRA
ncbi:type II toxin-antitoxin system VapC family toxin [Blastococcus brunescens]|uniref:Type II toxin-antitoxin system VapC family toxin n=1 Tax=Blastococcus brunescens TaxID=1564165 RepID=A0ABZ1B438_9ACTN|nr:type II toxin-antitoxin system VapC family toxin [Blastococcus sp. BMG 8361]WRL64114.1 type II toxin-antitoxin system VapC family toxin [Blastococcus sp. BMG 8361]